MQVRVLDVDGTRLVISAHSFPSTTPQDLAVLEEILASIQIGLLATAVGTRRAQIARYGARVPQ